MSEPTFEPGYHERRQTELLEKMLTCQRSMNSYLGITHEVLVEIQATLKAIQEAPPAPKVNIYNPAAPPEVPSDGIKASDTFELNGQLVRFCDREGCSETIDPTKAFCPAHHLC